LAEVAEIDVADDLGHQVVEAFHQLYTGIGIPGHTKRFQDQPAELVRGRDGRGVESSQCIAQPAAPFVEL
jgi:hypothetical protein